jgi:hypothetical protein
MSLLNDDDRENEIGELLRKTAARLRMPIHQPGHDVTSARGSADKSGPLAALQIDHENIRALEARALRLDNLGGR